MLDLKSETTRLEELEEKPELKLLAEKLDSMFKSIDSEIKRLAVQKRAIKELRVNLEKSDFASVLHYMRKDVVNNLRSTFPQSVGLLRQLEEKAKIEVQSQMLSFDKELRETITKSELRFEWWFPEIISGKFPEYLINKMIEVKVDRRDFSVWINDQKIETIDIRRITSQIISENNRLFRRSFSSKQFIEELYEAYEATLLKNKKVLGDPVYLKEVHRAMVFQAQNPRFFEKPTRQKFHPYFPDEFVVDLSRCLKEGATQTRNGMRLELHPLRDPRDCFFIVLPSGDRVFRGLISFIKVGRE